jgi:peroxiredoxin
MHLPTFETSGVTLLKRLTLVINEALIERVFYPVFSPDQNASEVMSWLTIKRKSLASGQYSADQRLASFG